VRTNLDWLVATKHAHYVTVINKNQPLLYRRLKSLPWKQVRSGAVTREIGHGRIETRTVKAVHVDDLDFPHARQALKITRWRQNQVTGKISRETIYLITDLTSADATAADLARLAREQWTIEAQHHVRDISFGKDHSTSRTGNGPINLATIRPAVVNAIKDAGYLHVPKDDATTSPPPMPSTCTDSHNRATHEYAGALRPAGVEPEQGDEPGRPLYRARPRLSSEAVHASIGSSGGSPQSSGSSKSPPGNCGSSATAQRCPGPSTLSADWPS
jgi:hypothetical protein